MAGLRGVVMVVGKETVTPLTGPESIGSVNVPSPLQASGPPVARRSPRFRILAWTNGAWRYAPSMVSLALRGDRWP